MARFCFFTQNLLLFFAAFLLASNSNLNEAVPQSSRAAGVFILTEGGDYTFNFTEGRAACLSLNITMATIAQMERAVQRGLEMCKYGWTAEQIAVVPRLTSASTCGQGKTGVVKWYASADKKFGVFCFNASDFEESLNKSTAGPQSSKFPTTLTALTQTTTPSSPVLRSTTSSPPSRKPITTSSPPSRKPITTKAPERTSFTSAFTLLVKTTHSTRVSSTSSTLKPFSTHIPTYLSHHITSKPTVGSFASSTSAHPSDFSVSSESVTPHLVSPAKPSPGDVPTTLIILGIILLLLTAAGVVWYYKLNIFTLWSHRRLKDNTETEMWKHTDSEMDMYNLDEEDEDEEELDIKYSSNIILCVNPDIKTNSSE
ncbi:lymphatic vessel endothelial hyaluronic receptor 1b isoform X1 [Micropterus dolomieu]|uniref:lymphatic vessel endothelial hyaluronic receptor 1b isoform X1 n=2 Tax=Micropterus dolomieu TaxID=147949 RepID=UPI001E8D214B|nr:lymphatic vessel endothelial hyaluronic receptor 1b isoform X1 [Micropterus dolomieu]